MHSGQLAALGRCRRLELEDRGHWYIEGWYSIFKDPLEAKKSQRKRRKHRDEGRAEGGQRHTAFPVWEEADHIAICVTPSPEAGPWRGVLVRLVNQSVRRTPSRSGLTYQTNIWESKYLVIDGMVVLLTDWDGPLPIWLMDSCPPFEGCGLRRKTLKTC
ncbi:hypothetical protein R3P38DRAFT_2767037 [Favolaschia claudopus]|uniref:Uncharacterized protein n=1 Tax=Favolaschia claudopus TaxID=2862362 RepID=A0AAW0CXD6_9AGAR